MMTTDRIPSKARNLRRHAALLSGADAGLYTLPPAVLNARGGVLRIASELDAITRPDLGAAEAAFITQVIAAAETNKKALPSVAVVTDVELDTVRVARLTGLLGQAIDQADAQFARLIGDTGDAIITEHLRPAVDEVMAGITVAAQALPGELSPEVILRADESARRAWLSLTDLAARYEAIRRGATSLRRDVPAEWDTRGDFSELWNFHELTAGYVIQFGGPRPWPTDTGGRLLWYVRNGGKVWLPTVAQQDARYREVHKDALEQMAENRQRVAGSRGQFG